MEDTNKYKTFFQEEENNEIWRNVFKSTRAIARRKRQRKIGAVICITLLGVGGYFYLRPETYNAVNSNLQVTLSDKSEITLYKGSSITVANFLLKKTRDVYLKGNGLFKVSKSRKKPFIVHGDGYETKVLGTVFKVTQINKTFSVDLYQGKVLVYQPETPKDSYELKPKQTFSNMGSLKVATIKPTIKNSQNNFVPLLTFSVKDIPLPEAVRIIENTYSIKLKYPTDRMNSIISVSCTSTNAHEIIHILATNLNLNINQIDDKTFELEE